MGICSSSANEYKPSRPSFNVNEWIRNMERRDEAIHRVPYSVRGAVSYDSTVGKYQDRNGRFY